MDALSQSDVYTALEHLFPIRGFVIELEFAQTVELPLIHNTLLQGWLGYLLTADNNHTLDSLGFHKNCRLLTPENGRSRYPAGETYLFGIQTYGQRAETLQLLGLLFTRLQNLPQYQAALRGRGVLNEQVHLLGLRCMVSGEPVSEWQNLQPLRAAGLQEQAECLRRQQRLQLQLYTPARIKQTEPLKHKNREAQFCRDHGHFSWQLLWQQCCHTLTIMEEHILGADGECTFTPPPPPLAECEPILSFWLNYQYLRPTGASVPAGGCLAEMTVIFTAALTSAQAAVLLLASYTGIGQKRASGYGALRWVADDGERWPVVCGVQRATTLLDACFTANNINRAIQRTLDAEKQNPSFNITATEFRTTLYQQLAAIRAYRYHPHPLVPVTIAKKDGTDRFLAVPPVGDRALQRVVTAQLSAELDPLFIQHSFGYRKGYSRQGARDAINQAIRAGYGWVLESDIDSFFDSVAWSQMATRLRLFMGQDPLVDLIMQWLQTPVQETPAASAPAPRGAGLPQGAPISPLLANLLLDDFDQDMIVQGMKLVRFADDFVLLFKNQQQAQQALPRVVQSLAEHGLALKPEKTRIVSAQQGFRYLGYLFLDGYAIETKPETATKPETETKLEIHARPTQQQAPSAPPKKPSNLGTRSDHGTTLILLGEPALISTHQGQVHIEQHSQTTHYPWNSLDSLIAIGAHQFTTPALKAAMHHQVPVHFANHYGEYEGCCAGAAPAGGPGLWLLQHNSCNNTEQALAVSRELICARIAQQHRLIQRRQSTAPELTALKRLQKKAENAATLDRLRGFEGAAARQLWAYFQRQLAPEWGFAGRKRRPPPDTINALLSLGYTWLYNITDTLVRSVGLDSYRGYYHQPQGAHAALASDLMEPFRHLVEGAVLTLVNRGQCRPDDGHHDGEGLRLSSASRKQLITQLTETLLRPLSATAVSPANRLEAMRIQVRAIENACRYGEPFRAWQE
ncbi:CRISPR-associated endonuclease Cas1 [Teredinibacter turnerae]|uniref:CRISPR-associated endonuclease Cas1 n=1 Tax=Teredinibacter turnerae TaxID=2426 RepID=UPI000AEB6280|nr:CRISPR-associated endonuclease Cas1 [Teredinibacter turnerae]